MRRRLDLSIGQRLALGFGTAGLLIALLGAMTHLWTSRIAAIRERQNAVVMPRAASADRLETAILYTGMAARTYVLLPSRERLQAYERVVERMRKELGALSALPRDADELEPMARVPPLVERYERATLDMVNAVGASRQVEALEPAAGAAREELLAAVRAYADLQQRKVDQGRDAITAAVSRMDRAAMGLGALVLGLLLFTAIVTTRSVRDPTLALVASARRLGAGDLEHALQLEGRTGADRPRRNELAELTQAFTRMALELKAREDRLVAGAGLSTALAASIEADRLCQAALEAVMGHLGLECGAVYLADERAVLRLRLGVGLAGSDERLEPGQGIPGRAAATRRSVVLSDLPADSPFSIRLGIDRLPPRAVAAIPMVLQDQVAGVMVVASARPLAPDAVAFLEQAGAQLAVSLQNAQAHERITQLAAELQEKNAQLRAQVEEIQSQQEELQAQNEEIHAQNEELQSQNEELQVQGEELRSVIERLAASEEALRDADRNKNDFLAVLSHELRNPLAPIRNSVAVLERAAPGSDQALRAQAVIERQVRQLTRLVEDLLDVTRISRGKVQLRRTGVELAKLVRQVAEDCGSEYAERGVALEVEAAAEVAVDGDPARLSQIVSNLLQNAAKFTPPGGRVLLALEAAEERARIRVRDTGAGMDPDTLKRLFQPFMQADVTLARTNGGLGLGLALVKGLVELHGGSIRATSPGRGQGAEFVVELPARREPVPVPPPRRPGTTEPRRVLIIEDNLDAANSLREVLALAGHHVEIACEGAEGIAKARAWRPDVLLCDIGLPDMDGHEVARTLRGDAELAPARLVALTGYALPEDQERAAEAGFDAHLAKPPSIEKLLELLATLEPIGRATAAPC